MPSLAPRIRCSALFALLVVLLSLSVLTTAQQASIIDTLKLPACVSSCTTLTEAQRLCVPPVAPVQSQAIYQTCFCQSNLLVNLKAGSAVGLCDAACSATDGQKIEQWFQSLCAAGAPVVTPAGSNQVTTSAATTSGTQSTSTAKSSGSSSKNTHPPWMSTHYRWIIMIIVLFLAAVGFVILGLWLKRRYNRKHSGHSPQAMLAAEDATNILKDKHPNISTPQMSKMDLPSWDGSVLMSGANSRDNIGSAGTSRGKLSANTLGGPNTKDVERDAGLGRSSSKLKKSSKSSKKSKKSER